jgi:ferredoxin
MTSTDNPYETSSSGMLAGRDFPTLIDALHSAGYTVIAPTLQDDAIVYDQIRSMEDLPIGWGDEQHGGHYSAKHRDDEALFAYAVGPRTWKRWLYPPRTVLWSAQHTQEGFEITSEETAPEHYAFLGVRSCELHAIGIQDKIFLQDQHQDQTYAQRREDNLIIAVNCSTPSGTCFCVSMDTGPKTTEGYDLALTEIAISQRHVFLVEAGSKRGMEILEKLPLDAAEEKDLLAANAVTDQAAQNMGRTLNTDGVKELLQNNPDHPRWSEVADRCLSCGNCTNVCPTCFCSTTEDNTSLDLPEAEHTRVWDTCFSLDFSYIQGANIRSDTRSRYRHWLTHKFANWHDQFDTSGCVGCGRCVTWCPVAIDVTEEITAIQKTTTR